MSQICMFYILAQFVRILYLFFDVHIIRNPWSFTTLWSEGFSWKIVVSDGPENLPSLSRLVFTYVCIGQ